MKTQYIKIDENGDKHYFSDKEMKVYHREDGPAIEWADGDKEWYRDGKIHREDGPAQEWNDGTKKWYRNDELHRTDGPAIEFASGSKCWYKNGKKHREDGPASERENGYTEWYIDGVQLTEAEFKAKKAPHNGKKVVVDGIEYTLQA